MQHQNKWGVGIRSSNVRLPKVRPVLWSLWVHQVFCRLRQGHLSQDGLDYLEAPTSITLWGLDFPGINQEAGLTFHLLLAHPDLSRLWIYLLTTQRFQFFFLRGPGENSCPISSRNIICWFKIPLPPYPHSPEKISFCETKARNISWLFLTLPLTLRHPTKTKSRGPTACSYGERAWEKPVRISNVIQPPLINTFLLSFWSHKIFAVINCDFFLGKWY